MKNLSCLVLVSAVTASAACSGVGDSSTQGAVEEGTLPEGVGQLSAYLTLPAASHDVSTLRYKLVAPDGTCDDDPIDQRDVALETEALPEHLDPGPEGTEAGQHEFADALFVLDAGKYLVCVEPLQESGDPSVECYPTMALADVFGESTTEVQLVSQCAGNPKGALDVIGVLNDPPKIDDLVISPSKFITVCEDATITVQASDANGDAFEYFWMLEELAPGSTDAGLTNSRNVATFSPDAPGRYMIRAAVMDYYEGGSSLLFPVHVSADDSCEADPVEVENPRIR